MTKQIEITVPEGHVIDPTCPHCFEPLGAYLRDAYPEDDPHGIGGEHRCPHCDGVFSAYVYRPEPTFNVVIPEAYANVRHISTRRR